MRSTQHSFVKARKPHKCAWCGDDINVGDSYARWTVFDYELVYNCKMHKECFDACRASSAKTFDMYSQVRGMPAE